MPVKFNKSLKRLKVFKIIEEVKPRALKNIEKFIKDEILKTIRSGRSPVQKGADGVDRLRFPDYSDSYKKAMGKGKLKDKKKRPVNLEHTGKLLKSIRSKRTREYVKVWFTDKKAKFHDKLGAGKKKVKRRMVPNPKKGEQFNAGIRKKIVNAVSMAIKSSKR